MPVPVVGLGAGGHAKVVLDMLQRDPRYEVVGLVDTDRAKHGEMVAGLTVLGNDDELGRLVREGVRHFFMGLGGAVEMRSRRNLYEKALKLGLEPIAVIHETAIISPSVRIGDGVTVMARAVINVDASLGDNVIINTGAIVEHDCKIGNHVHIATGAQLAGAVVVGDETMLGIGATVRQQIHIGRNVLVGAGAVVVRDVADGSVVIGNPARLQEK